MDAMEQLRNYQEKYRAVRLRVIRCRNGRARMIKLKNKEHEEAYAQSLEDNLCIMKHLHGNIRLLMDVVKKTA